MKFLRLLLLCLSFGLIPACGLLPTVIGQKTVPKPVEKTPAQIEAERQAADLVAKGIQEPESLKPVAQGLSDSLGKPANPLPSATPEQVNASALLAIENLNAAMAKMQKQIEAQNKFLAKYAGKPIEGTGFDLLGPGMATLVIGLIVLGVACPPALTIMFFIFRRLKAASAIVVNSLEEAGKDEGTKGAVSAIKAKVAERMQRNKQPTSALKAVITDLKHAPQA